MEIYTTGTFAAVVIGFFCGNTVSLPTDPRQRMSCPKLNPSRVHTPAGTVSWGGSCMSIYPVASPGGYQMTGRTVSIFDAFGTKPGFTPATPWLFRDFDLLTFYRVDEAEMDSLLADWEAGKYVFRYEETVFDMGKHNELLRETAEEVKVMRAKQAVAQEEMGRRDTESLRRWREEKEREKVDVGTVEALMAEEGVEAVEAPMDANVWKVRVEEGQLVERGEEVVVLEAMKLEIAVRFGEVDAGTGAGSDKGQGKKAKVEKVLVRQGETVKAGANIALMRWS